MGKDIIVTMTVPEEDYDQLILSFAYSFGYRGTNIDEALKIGERQVREWVLYRTMEVMAQRQAEIVKQQVIDAVSEKFKEFLKPVPEDEVNEQE